MTIETEIERHEDDNHGLKPGTQGTFIVDSTFDTATRLFSIHHVLNVTAERVEDDDDLRNTLWLMASLVEEVSYLFHNSRSAIVVRSGGCGEVDVEITGKTEQPKPLRPGELDSFISRLLPNQPGAH